MARPIYQRVAVTDTGDIIPGAEYTVTNESTGLEQTIYNARSGGSVISQPAFADSNGVIQFWTDPGVTYRVQASGGVGTYTDRYVLAVDLIDSPADTTAGRVMTTGAGGLLRGPSIINSGSMDDLTAPGNYFVGAGTSDKPIASDAFLVSCVSGSVSGLNNRVTQKAMVYASVNANRQFIRSFDGSTWSPWRELYHTGNLNTLEFGADATNDYLFFGYAESPTVPVIVLPLNSFSPPSSITVTGTFTLRYRNNTIIQTGLGSADFNLTSVSNGRNAIIVISGITGLTAERLLYLRAESSNSKITVNP